MLNIKVKYHNPNLIHITKITQGDWIDLRASHTYELQKDDFALINLGISMKLPEGYEAHIAPRSSTFKNYGVIQTNSVGVVDNSYSGNNDIWMMPVYATRNCIIEQNDRICQFRLVKKMDEVNFSEVDNLDGTDRGGFGSSGIQ